MIGRIAIVLLISLATPAYADWQPAPGDDRQVASKAVLDDVREAGGDDFAAMFDEA